MVGVIVIGVIAGTIAATVFAVIPWSQDSAAKQGLDAVRTAESVAQVQDSRFSGWQALRDSGRIQASDTVSVATDDAGSCYVAVSASAGGTVYFATDTDPTAREVTSGSAPGCVTDVEFAALTAGVGGVTVLPASIVSFGAGANHTFAIDSAGRLWGWGLNDYGQLGDGTTVSRSVPVPVDSSAFGGKKITSLSAGLNHTVALDESGKLWAWGRNRFGAIGDGSTVDRHIPTAVNTAALTEAEITSLSTGYESTTVQDSSGKLWAWGYNIIGQLGNNSLTNTLSPSPVYLQDLGGAPVTDIAVGSYHTIATDRSGRLWAWGSNSKGQLGNGTTKNSPVPVLVKKTLLAENVVTSLAAGDAFSLALDESGAVWSWGSNFVGQLGSNSYGDRTYPGPVYGLSDRTVSSIAAGERMSLALDSTGTVLVWGANQFGEWGDGTADAYAKRSLPAPVDVAALDGKIVTEVAAGDNHVAIQDSAGSLWGWGRNYAGQLGTGNTNETYSPTTILPFP
jgi:alpha-tubulin suppressor-like RCC1 family protein